MEQEVITIMNIYAPNAGTLNFIKSGLQDSKIRLNHNSLKVGDFNSQLSPLDRST